MTIMAEAPDKAPPNRETTVEAGKFDHLDEQRAIASALIGLLAYDLPTAYWPINSSGGPLEGLISRLRHDGVMNVDAPDLALEALRRWSEFWFVPIYTRNKVTSDTEHCIFQIEFKYRHVRVVVWTPIKGRENVRRALVELGLS